MDEENVVVNTETTESNTEEIVASENDNLLTEKTVSEQNEKETFAKVRHSVESKYKKLLDEKNAELEAERQKANDFEYLTKSLEKAGYKGAAKDIAREIRAAAEGVTVDEILKKEQYESSKEDEIKRRIEEAITKDERVIKANEIIRERTFEQDIQKIKTFYPECNVSKIEDIGDVYIKIMASGLDDPVAAYEAQMSYNKRNIKEVPPTTGSVKNTAPAEKEYYTPEEVDKLDKKDLNSPGVLEKVFQSMAKWGKKKGD